METLWKPPKAIFSLVSGLGFLFWVSPDSDVFARAGTGRSSGSRGYSSGGSYQKSSNQSLAPGQRDYQHPGQQPRPRPAAAGSTPFSGLAGGLAGGLLGRTLF